MGQYKTPGVYIVEKNAFPNSVVEVATAVPAFIGYTKKADNRGKSLLNKAWRISTMSEFYNFFGGPPKAQFSIMGKIDKDYRSFLDAINKKNDSNAKELSDDEIKQLEADFSIRNKTEYNLVQKDPRFFLYYSMMLFYKNGGGACYIVSVGDYNQSIVESDLEKGLIVLSKEQEPTMVVIPDAMSLSRADCVALQQATLKHCGEEMKDRFAILDIYDGYKGIDTNCVENFRNELGVNNLDFSAAYYPWLNTSIVQTSDVWFYNVSNLEKLQTILTEELRGGSLDDNKKVELGKKIDELAVHQSIANIVDQIQFDEAKKEFKDKIDEILSLKAKLSQSNDKDKPEITKNIASKTKDLNGDIDKIQLDDPVKEDVKGKIKALLEKEISVRPSTPEDLHKILSTYCPIYNTIMLGMKDKLNLLPPSAAMAGIYTSVDNSRGVWKAPANVSLNAVISPAVPITHDQQEDLNVTTAGKSINAIRAFIGEGTLVWGARTLDGNSLDWRYINVRRTMIMLEESIKLATKAYVFDPNVSITWVTIKSMISNFLTSVWKRGGLAGASPEDAFSVHVGLGDTMTPQDILDGILRVTVLVALSRPAEFIEITFQQQLQKS